MTTTPNESRETRQRSRRIINVLGNAKPGQDITEELMDAIKPEPVTQWNGEPCKARRVLIVVGECQFPQGWYRHLVGTEMRAVEITYGSETFYIADQDGNGWHKVAVEGGGPHWGHKSLTCARVIQERTELDTNDCHCGRKL